MALMDHCDSDVTGGILSSFVGMFKMPGLGSLAGRRHERFVLWHVDQVAQVTKGLREVVVGNVILSTHLLIACVVCFLTEVEKKVPL